MAAKELGNKHVCFKCSTKFYDLKKPEPICPKCGADQREMPAKAPEKERKRPARLAPVEPTVEEPALEEEQIEEDEEIEEEEEEAYVSEDDED